MSDPVGMADWRDSRGGHIPWRSSLPSGGGRRRGGSSITDTVLPRLPLILGAVLVVLVLLWIVGVANGGDDDRSLAEEVDRALSRAGYPELQVTETDGALTLTGVLQTAEDRTIALAVARSVEGTDPEAIDDRLEAPDAVPETGGGAAPAGPSSAADLQLQAALSGLTARDPIRFDSGSTTIVDASLATLDAIAALLTATPDTSVEVAGHTDADGDETENQTLSTQRAQAVVDALVQRGVAAERLGAVGFGEAFPIASNDTQEGKDRNRRIELNVLPAGTTPQTATTTTTPAETTATTEAPA
jgi:outer membrane protein OmpA-like peptidoglycan-associated protein